MAAITPTAFRIVRVSDLGQEEVVSSVHDADRQGKVHYIDTTGEAVVAQADTLAKAGGGSGIGALIGIASTKPRSNLANESVTILRDADVWLGEGVLDDLDIGAPIFLSAATAGGLDDTAPSTQDNAVVQIGYVVPTWRESGMDKLMRISTEWAAMADAIAVVPGE